MKARIGEGEGAHLRHVVVDEARNRAFVSVFGYRDKPSAIWVVDTAANTLAHVITEGLEGGISGRPTTRRGTASSPARWGRTRWWR
ncbi:hypothetical protein [Teichococcus aestuarii]|uniref:hypothetical protein n=1 Tax=Teichococcus aestuarii TaxID=568898 RepID=UPI00360B9F1A